MLRMLLAVIAITPLLMPLILIDTRRLLCHDTPAMLICFAAAAMMLFADIRFIIAPPPFRRHDATPPFFFFRRVTPFLHAFTAFMLIAITSPRHAFTLIC